MLIPSPPLTLSTQELMITSPTGDNNLASAVNIQPVEPQVIALGSSSEIADTTPIDRETVNVQETASAQETTEVNRAKDESSLQAQSDRAISMRPHPQLKLHTHQPHQTYVQKQQHPRRSKMKI